MATESQPAYYLSYAEAVIHCYPCAVIPGDLFTGPNRPDRVARGVSLKRLVRRVRLVRMIGEAVVVARQHVKLCPGIEIGVPMHLLPSHGGERRQLRGGEHQIEARLKGPHARACGNECLRDETDAVNRALACLCFHQQHCLFLQCWADAVRGAVATWCIRVCATWSHQVATTPRTASGANSKPQAHPHRRPPAARRHKNLRALGHLDGQLAAEVLNRTAEDAC